MHKKSVEPQHNSPDIYKAAVVRTASLVGDFMTLVTLMVLYEGRGVPGWMMGALVIAGALPTIVAAPIIGAVVDHVDSRLILVVANLVQSGLCLLLYNSTSFYLSVLLLCLLAFSVGLSTSCLQAIVPQMAGPNALARSMSVVQVASWIGMLGSPMLAGLLIESWCSMSPMLVSSLLTATASVVSLSIKTRGIGSKSRRPVTDDVADDYSWHIWSDRQLLIMIASVALSLGIINGINVIEVLFVRRSLDGSTLVYGALSSTWVSGTVVGGLAVGGLNRWTKYLRPTTVLVGGMAIVSVCLLSAALVSHWALLFPLWLLAGAASGAVLVIVPAEVASRTPSNFRGRAFSGLNASINAGTTGGYLLAGATLTAWDPRLALATVAVGSLCTTAIAGAAFWIYARSPPVHVNRAAAH